MIGEPDRAWALHWQRIGPLLDEVRREELENLDWVVESPHIDALLQIACELAEPTETSGMVEMQRLFQQGFQAQQAKQ